MRTTPALAAPPWTAAAACCDGLGAPAALVPLSIGPSAWIAWPFAALRGADRPDFGTGTRSMLEARGLPCSIGLKVPAAAQAEAGLAMLEDGGGLPRQDLGDLSGLEVGDLDLAAEHADLGAARIHGDAELRSLDHGGEIGRLDLEMLDVALLDLEQDRTCLLDDGGRETLLLLGRQADHRVGRDQDRFLAADEQHAPITSGANGVAGLECLLLIQRNLLRAAGGDPDLAGGLADRPDAIVRGGCAGGRSQDQRSREGAPHSNFAQHDDPQSALQPVLRGIRNHST